MNICILYVSNVFIVIAIDCVLLYRFVFKLNALFFGSKKSLSKIMNKIIYSVYVSRNSLLDLFF
jgi:hypothetical protein